MIDYKRVAQRLRDGETNATRESVHDDPLPRGELSKSGLDRILQYTEQPFALMTAFRDEYSLKENRQRNARLVVAFKDANVGPIRLIGFWAETTSDDTRAPEECFFVPKPHALARNDFRSLIVQQLQQFDQDVAIYGDGKRLFLLKADRTQYDIGGPARLERVADDAYSVVRGRPTTRFVFEGTIVPASISGRWAFRSHGLSWVRTYGYDYNDDPQGNPATPFKT